MQTLTYLASPYSHADPEVEELRFEEVCRAAAHFLNSALIGLFCPIAMAHAIRKVRPNLKGSWDRWAEQDYAFLDCSKQLYVLTLDGWEDSVGVTAEIEFAWAKGIPVYLVSPDTCEVSKDEYLPQNCRDN
jgi:nucleoside 2-deoxyribosyltransferase